jgi:hypothetical protein
VTTTWRTWLLVRDLDESLQGWARRASLLDRFEFSGRPLASLGVDGNDAVLRTPGKSSLFAYLNRMAAPGKPPLRVFATTRGQDLQFLHGKEFFYKGLKYRIVRHGRSATDSDPYGHRLFAVEHLGADVPRDQQTGQTVVLEERPREESALFFDPLPIELSDAGTLELAHDLQPGGADADISGGCFLPPVRASNHPDVAQSYFGSDPAQLRHRLRASAGIDVQQVDEPVAVHLQRLTDEPLLRDLLLDGGSLRVADDEGAATAVHLTVNTAGAGWVASRAELVLHGRLPGPSWAVHIAQAIRDDVRARVTAVLPASDRSQWTLDSEASNNMVPWKGSWHRLARSVLPALEKSRGDTGEFFRTNILDPALSYHTETFDHYLSETLFIAYAWRCPWAASGADQKAWRRATLDLLDREFDGRHPSAHERVREWNDEARQVAPRRMAFVADAAPPPHMRVRYTGDPDDEEVLYRRLLLPIGTVLNARTIYLDKALRSQLDRGLVLA